MARSVRDGVRIPPCSNDPIPRDPIAHPDVRPLRAPRLQRGGGAGAPARLPPARAGPRVRFAAISRGGEHRDYEVDGFPVTALAVNLKARHKELSLWHSLWRHLWAAP